MEPIFTLEYPCGGETHRIAFDRRLRWHLLDHDTRVVAAFTRMGATPPECQRKFEYDFDLNILSLDMAYASRRPSGRYAISPMLWKLGQRPHDTVVRQLVRWFQTATRKSTLKERFGRFITASFHHGDIGAKTAVQLAPYMGPYSRAMLAFIIGESNAVSQRERADLLLMSGTPPIPAGVFALSASDITAKQRAALGRLTTPKLRGWLSNTPFKLPKKDRLQLVNTSTSEQQCWVARLADWVTSAERAQFARECSSWNVIRDEIVPKLEPLDVFKMLRSELLRLQEYRWTTIPPQVMSLIASRKVAMTARQRYDLFTMVPENKYHRLDAKKKLAKMLYRARRSFGFSEKQVHELKTFSRSNQGTVDPARGS
jgi:hypothetical protein